MNDRGIRYEITLFVTPKFNILAEIRVRIWQKSELATLATRDNTLPLLNSNLSQIQSPPYRRISLI